MCPVFYLTTRDTSKTGLEILHSATRLNIGLPADLGQNSNHRHRMFCCLQFAETWLFVSLMPWYRWSKLQCFCVWFCSTVLQCTLCFEDYLVNMEWWSFEIFWTSSNTGRVSKLAFSMNWTAYAEFVTSVFVPLVWVLEAMTKSILNSLNLGQIQVSTELTNVHVWIWSIVLIARLMIVGHLLFMSCF